MAHKELQEHASVSQKFHEEMLSYAKQADIFKKSLVTSEKEIKQLLKDYSEKKEKFIFS